MTSDNLNRQIVFTDVLLRGRKYLQHHCKERRSIALYKTMKLFSVSDPATGADSVPQTSQSAREEHLLTIAHPLDTFSVWVSDRFECGNSPVK